MNSSLRKLPDYTQLDLFHADFDNIAMRALREVMERPFFALSNKPRSKPIIYKTSGAEVTISGGEPYGIATIYDHDILMWLVSQIVEAKDRGEETSPQLYFTPYDCLRGIQRRTGGSEYQLLAKSIQRLANTHIMTDIRKKDQIPLSLKERERLKIGFHWLESYGIQSIEKRGRETPQGITVVVPRWLYNGAVKHNRILTIDDRYFRLKGGLERVLYLIARKHCGNQKEGFVISMEKLYQKTGSESLLKVFASRIRKIAKEAPLPEYAMTVYKGKYGGENVQFFKRSYLAYEDKRYEPPRVSKGKEQLRLDLDWADENLN